MRFLKDILLINVIIYSKLIFLLVNKKFIRLKLIFVGKKSG